MAPPPDAGPRSERTGGLYPTTPSDTGGWNPPRPHQTGGFASAPPYPTGGHPSAPPHLTGGFASPHSFNPTGGRPAPVEPMERTAWADRGPGSAPTQWGAPSDEPDLELPDRRRRPPGSGAFDRSARHGESETPPRPKATPWQTALGAVAVALLVAVCAAGSYFMFTDHSPGGGAVPAGPTGHDISNRAADAAQLTDVEVFPTPTVGAGYQVLPKPQVLTDCKAAAVGEPVKMLSVQDCTQVVRAALLSADRVYVITAGLFNFGTQVNAQQASDSIRDSVGAQKGRFTGLNLGSPPSDVYARAATQLGWDVRGHFLAYCVIARADAKPIDASDQSAHQITDQLVEKYLIGTVLEARVSPPGSAPAGGQPSTR
jgi:hypothetical protein